MALQKIGVVAGGTGLVGRRLLELMQAAPEYGRIVALTRRPNENSDAKVQWQTADFGDVAGGLADLRGADAVPLDVFCCLGTTIAAAGSRDAFRQVDFEYVVGLARWAAAVGARRFLVISALGADPTSRVFYNRVKGEMEVAVGRIGLASLVILRPSLLDGARAQVRPGERLALRLTRPIRGMLPKSLRPVRDVEVAAAMLWAARQERPPECIASSQIVEIGLRI